MRIWDVPCKNLCDRHLIFEHRDLHAIFLCVSNVSPVGIGNGLSYKETKRWNRSRLGLWLRHREQARELYRRGFVHKSPLGMTFTMLFTGIKPAFYIDDSLEQQLDILRTKNCDCDTLTPSMDLKRRGGAW